MLVTEYPFFSFCIYSVIYLISSNSFYSNFISTRSFFYYYFFTAYSFPSSLLHFLPPYSSPFSSFSSFTSISSSYLPPFSSHFSSLLFSQIKRQPANRESNSCRTQFVPTISFVNKAKAVKTINFLPLNTSSRRWRFLL